MQRCPICSMSPQAMAEHGRPLQAPAGRCRPHRPRQALAQPILFFFLTKNEQVAFRRGGGRLPPARQEKTHVFLLLGAEGSRPPPPPKKTKRAWLCVFSNEKKIWAGPGLPGQALAWSWRSKSGPKCRFGPNHQKFRESGLKIGPEPSQDRSKAFRSSPVDKKSK